MMYYKAKAGTEARRKYGERPLTHLERERLSPKAYELTDTNKQQANSYSELLAEYNKLRAEYEALKAEHITLRRDFEELSRLL